MTFRFGIKAGPKSIRSRIKDLPSVDRALAYGKATYSDELVSIISLSHSPRRLVYVDHAFEDSYIKGDIYLDCLNRKVGKWTSETYGHYGTKTRRNHKIIREYVGGTLKPTHS